MNRIQRVISFLLALIMVIGMAPPRAVSAEETEPTQVVTEPSEETVASTEPVTETTEATTEPTDAVTEPVEETTVPTEAVTEPVEETTVPTEVVTEFEVESSAPTEEKTEVTEPGFTIGPITQVPGLSTATGIGVVTGICGENMSWELKDGVLRISGIGEMPDYDIDSSIYAPWYDYRAYITAVMIESGVTGIGNDAFYSCECIVSASLPDGLLQIGVNGFYGCSALTSILFPESVQSIGSKAFAYCDSLRSITFEGDAPAVDCPGSGPSVIFFTVTATVFYPEDNTTWTSGVQQEFGNLANISWESYRPMVATGNCGNNIAWTIDDNGLMFISGSGDMPYRFTEPYDYPWHPYAESVKRLIVDEGITGISNSAFRDFVNLTQARIADSVGSIGRNAFYGCTSLKTVVLPESIDYIHEFTFAVCTSLEAISIPDKVTDIARYAFSSCSNLQDIQLPEKLHHIAEYAFAGCTSLKELKIPDGCGWGMGIVQNCTGLTRITLPKDMASMPDDLFYGCENLKFILFRGNAPVFEENYRFPGKNLIAYYPEGNDTWTEAVSQDYGGTVTWVPYDPDEVLQPVEPDDPDLQITPLLEDQVIQLNGAGVAYAVFKTGPHKKVRYIVDNAAYKEKADENGFARLYLGQFDTRENHPVTLKITHVGEHEYIPMKVYHLTVAVSEPTFKQEWKLSFSPSVKMGLGTGIEAADIEATLGKLSFKMGYGTALNIERTVCGDQVDLELTADIKVKDDFSFESGVTQETKKVNFRAGDVSSGVNLGLSGTYGIKICDYQGTAEQDKAIGTFILGEVLTTIPTNLLYKPLYLLLASSVYNEGGCDIIDGNSVVAGADAGMGMGILKINEEEIFKGIDHGYDLSYSISTKHSDWEGTEKEVSMATDETLSALIASCRLFGDKQNGYVDASGTLASSVLGKETTVTLKDDGRDKILETEYIAKESANIPFFIFGEEYKTYHEQFVFRNESLEELIQNTNRFGTFVNTDFVVLTLRDYSQMSNVISESSVPIEYNHMIKDQKLFQIPFEIGVKAKGTALNITASYLESTKYTDQTGFAWKDHIYRTGNSEGITVKVDADSVGLKQIVTDALGALVDEIAGFFTELIGTNQEGVGDFWGWIPGNSDRNNKWIISLVSGNTGVKTWSMSERIRVFNGNSAATYGRSSTQDAESAVIDAVTVGRPFIVNVTDASTNEEVVDFGEEPLAFTIRYAEEDLAAAGLSMDDPVVQAGGIAMYRCSDDGDFFEYVDAVNDLESMTVTAMITKPGQYVLAVDSCAPSISYLDVSDFHETPTITAYMSDMSGLDLDRFTFSVDGQIKVDSGNIADFYDQKASVFTYAVPEVEALSEGAHTICFTLADTSGNYDEYTYSFEVDLTAPVISDLSVTGVTNEGSVVEIRAQVSDPNLTAVFAVLSKKLPDGTWSAEVPVAMSDLGDGSWGLDYEGDGSFIKIYVEAVDIADNNAVSDTLTVNPVLESFTLNQEHLNLRPGQIAQLEAVIQPASLAEFLTWEVEGNSAILSVSETGEVTAQRIGTAYVLGTVTDGNTERTVRCRINVAEENSIVIEASEMVGQDCVWIDGAKYTLRESGDMFCVDVPDSNARTMIAYTYHMGDSTDIHTQYPVSMKVWTLKNENGFYTATRVEELDNILQYSGMSIRVTGKRGIRMITSIEKSKKDALISDGLAGYTLKEYGTVVAWADQLDDSKPLILGKPYAKSNYAYKKGVADPVFAYDGDLMQYTNVLVNFSDEQCKKDIALRPYMILEDTEGQTIIVYGGIVIRSIGYIAYQNRNTFEFGTEAYGYVWNIIHNVYGDIYDAQYKG